MICPDTSHFPSIYKLRKPTNTSKPPENLLQTWSHFIGNGLKPTKPWNNGTLWHFGPTLNLKIMHAWSALILILAGKHQHHGSATIQPLLNVSARSSSYTLYFHDNRAVRCSAYQSLALIKKLLYSCWRHCLDLVRNGFLWRGGWMMSKCTLLLHIEFLLCNWMAFRTSCILYMRKLENQKYNGLKDQTNNKSSDQFSITFQIMSQKNY